MKRQLIALLLAATMAVAACSTNTTSSIRVGVDDAPELFKNTFLTVARQAATLADYEATTDQWMDFAREVCGLGFETSEDLVDFVGDRPRSSTDPLVRQMWSTAADAATTAFCPIGRT